MLDLVLASRPAPRRRGDSFRSRAPWIALAGGVLLSAACTRPAPAPNAIRLIDGFQAKFVEGGTGKTPPPLRRTEWKFDGPAPAPPPAAPGPAGSPPPPPAFPATRGWEAGPGIEGLAIRDGLLVGRTTAAIPLLHFERRTGLDNPDQVYAVEIRMRASAGTNLGVNSRPAATIDLKLELAQVPRLPWAMTSPLIAGNQIQTYTITPPAPISGSRLRHILIRPTDVAGAEFAIESVRVIFRREHLAEVPSGVSWQGLSDIFRETLVTRSPETVRIPLTLPSRPLFDLSIGTPEDGPVTFKVGVRRGSEETTVMTTTVTTPHRWQRRTVDLTPFAGAGVVLSLSASAEGTGALAFWGAPAVRQRVARDGAAAFPQGVILTQLDTLRTDHLDLYGYERSTAPTLTRLAQEGAHFRNAITQTSWTKAETPSIMTSLYPSTHGVFQIPDRLPASATTIAEIYRQAGYATASFSSTAFTGKLTNLHQGFEELHESESTVGKAGPKGSKTSREFVDRLLEWIGAHRDVPFFVYLHVFDPHAPYEPNRPYDTLWADPKGREEYARQQEAIKKTAKDAFMGQRGMATPEELVAAGVDPAAFIRYSKDWYDGSIRGMDTEIARLIEGLKEQGLADRSLVALYADHGEEFHDHGRMWHGQSVYGEMVRVPLVFWAPGRVPKGLKIEEPVELIDILPTLATMSGLPVPEGAQGQNMGPLLGAPGPAWKRRPPISEKQSLGGEDFPSAAESYAIMDGDWKLIHNVARPPEKPEFELFDFYKDPLDQKNVAAEHPDVVERLGKTLDAWHQMAKAARLKPDSETTKGMSKEQLDQLRTLGYVK